MSSVMWELLLILQNEPLCILFSSSNGNWLASIFFYVSHMAIIKFRAHKIDMIFVGRQVLYVSVVLKNMDMTNVVGGSCK